MEQVEGPTVVTECLDRLVDPPVESNEVTPCTEGEPVQVDAGTGGPPGDERRLRSPGELRPALAGHLMGPPRLSSSLRFKPAYRIDCSTSNTDHRLRWPRVPDKADEGSRARVHRASHAGTFDSLSSLRRPDTPSWTISGTHLKGGGSDVDEYRGTLEICSVR